MYEAELPELVLRKMDVVDDQGTVKRGIGEGILHSREGNPVLRAQL